MSDNTL